MDDKSSQDKKTEETSLQWYRISQNASSESKEHLTKSHKMLCSNKKQHPHSLSLEMLPPDLTLVVKPFHCHQKLPGSFAWEKNV